MQSLQGKNVLITGGGRGIGLAAARELAKEGCRIGLTARSERQLNEAAEELRADGVEVIPYAADLRSEEEAHAAVREIEEGFGSIDILINNAGVGTKGEFLDIPPSEWQKVWDTNVMGIVHVTQAVLPGMKARGHGDIINISSMSGLKGTPGSSAYSASKFAVIGMSESLMQEVRRDNIRVMVLTPSLVETEMTRPGGERNPEKFTQAEDLAEYMTSLLKLEQRTFIKTSAIWATNPFEDS
ncbi:3-ketoacyl-ACP reductase [Alkalicoccus urumqiensis]|uniref:3-ketoacyl-ACP reductase n=1 Tax=Alkalicoccus urumqiensis TaxID=1548213 RepID=A0A2P6MID9_ALKUR|nr:3-ketoacyl-ACP reductase [Alkalicoccus urumqiensis]PRO66052.1 3-ketoacyl-ACP reductase [Alkalicoccus urumqiensis]